MGVLSGIRVIEIAGIGPGPFCGMLLADMGADVILIERADSAGTMPLGQHAIVHRGKRSVKLNLKDPLAVQTVLRLLASADVLIEGMRPGVMERLGLGPDTCLQANPRLVYGRMTGWGQDGPLAQSAGHEINYIALSGALWFSGMPDSPPTAAPTLSGDLGGGALYLALGIVAALLHVRGGGSGQVIDAAIVDGSANLMNLLLSLHGAGMQPMQRGQGLLDGPHWYGTYRCADDACITIGPIEPKFNALMFEKLGLADDPAFAQPYDPAGWPTLRGRLEQVFALHPQSHWMTLLEGTDACFAPVLHPGQAMTHPHLQARHVYSAPGGLLQAAPAPRFSLTPSQAGARIPSGGEHGEQILRELGCSDEDIRHLLDQG